MPDESEAEVTAAELAALARKAEEAAQKAYAPYSGFFVGAALLLESGETVTGANVENASYRLTVCAEQAAIAAAVAQFGPAMRIKAVSVTNRNGAASQPCGACRQTIAEFAPGTAMVQFPGASGRLETRSLAELLPGTFVLESRKASDDASD